MFFEVCIPTYSKPVSRIMRFNYEDINPFLYIIMSNESFDDSEFELHKGGIRRIVRVGDDVVIQVSSNLTPKQLLTKMKERALDVGFIFESTNDSYYDSNYATPDEWLYIIGMYLIIRYSKESEQI